MSLADKSFKILRQDMCLTVLRIFTGAVVARYLGPEGFGLWAVLEVITHYSRVFGGLRFEISSIYFYGQKKYERGELLFLTNLVSLTISSLIALFLLTQLDFVKGLFFKHNAPPSLLMAIVVCHIPLLFIKRNYMYALLSREDVPRFNRLILMQDLTQATIKVSLLVFFAAGLWSLAIGMFVSSIVGLIYGIYHVHRVDHMIFRFSPRLFVEMLRYSSKVYVSEALGFLNNYISNLPAAMYLAPAQLAFFTMGKGKVDWLNRFSSAVSSVLYPRVSNLGREKDSHREGAEVSARAFRVCFMIMVILGVVLSVAIYPMTIVLYGRAFLPLTLCFWVVAPGVVLYSASTVLRQYYLGIGRADIPMKISIAPVILQGGLCFLLIPTYGYLGAASAVLVSSLLTAIITVVVFVRITHKTYATVLIPDRSDIQLVIRIVKDKWSGFVVALRRFVAKDRNHEAMAS